VAPHATCHTSSFCMNVHTRAQQSCDHSLGTLAHVHRQLSMVRHSPARAIASVQVFTATGPVQRLVHVSAPSSVPPICRCDRKRIFGQQESRSGFIGPAGPFAPPHAQGRRWLPYQPWSSGYCVSVWVCVSQLLCASACFFSSAFLLGKAVVVCPAVPAVPRTPLPAAHPPPFFSPTTDELPFSAYLILTVVIIIIDTR
jgi:hypothetical protein